MSVAEIIRALMAERKGILFADEGGSAEEARLTASRVSGEDARRAYRELLFTTPCIEAHLSGVIMSAEAFKEKTTDGVSFPQFLAQKNIMPGVALDASAPEETAALLEASAASGATFAACIANASASEDFSSSEFGERVSALAASAKRARETNLAPLALLDVSMDAAPDAARAEDALVESLSVAADALGAAGLDPARLIVGVSIASPARRRTSAAEVAERTARAATTALPEKLGGVVFLSDAESAEEATANLNALARLEPLPWPIAFCFLRALQDPVLAAWQGSAERFAEAQSVFENRLSLLSQADAAGYAPDLETGS